MKNTIILLILLFTLPSFAITVNYTSRIYIFELKEEIGAKSWRKTQKAFKEAQEWNANTIIIHMNTYGGLLSAADSIRTAILNSKIPVWVFIDDNAASAGALISIAAKKIFMTKGSSIGSATVVDQQGTPAPDKFQSYMRSRMRTTAEAHGGDTIITKTDTIITWKRNPKIAEAMVDPDIEIKDVSKKGKVLAFTTNEAIRHGYCEGEFENINQIISKYITAPYETKEQQLTSIDHIINFFINPIVQGILIMLIIAGIYFELQSPGIGFALAVSIICTILYFIPLYIEGIAAYWEIILFVAGVLLLIVEIFVTPGLGLFGVVGAAMTIAGLTLAMIDSVELIYNPMLFVAIGRSLLLVTIVSIISIFGSIWLGGKLFTSKHFKALALNDMQKISQGYVGIDVTIKTMKGKTGIAKTDLRPSGSVEIELQQYDAKAINGYINVGDNVIVVRDEMAQLYVKKM